MAAPEGITVVVGGGAMGIAAVRRIGSPARVLLADVGEASLATGAAELRDAGFDVTTQLTDVADAGSMSELAATAAGLGSVQAIVHTAGVSPVQASAERVIAVDLLGVAHLLAAFEPVVAPGGAGVVVASMAGHLLPPLSAEDAGALRAAAPDELAAVACVQRAGEGDPGFAYAFAKQAVGVLVAAASVPWGRRGARINAISPGVIDTPMGRAELEGASGEIMRMMVDASGTQRLGTTHDIAAAAEFLLSEAASFVTGVDLLVDGGVVAAVRSGALG